MSGAPGEGKCSTRHEERMLGVLSRTGQQGMWILPADVRRDHKGQKNELSQIADDIECLAEEHALFK